MFERKKRSIKLSRAISSSYVFPLKKSVSFTYGRTKIERSLKHVGSSSHVNNPYIFIDICEDDGALECPSFPYQHLPKDWDKRFNE